MLRDGVVAGLYAITPNEPDTEQLARKARLALRGGARILQYRNKGDKAALRKKQGAILAALCHAEGVPLIINDDVELALAVGADGVHLGRGDAQIAHARSLLPPHSMIGASCYNSLELAHMALRAGATYVAFGSAFPSNTKPGAVLAPLSLYRAARSALEETPIVAIGGITPDNAESLIESGVDAVAVIDGLFGAADIEGRAREFSSRFQPA